ncbi:FimV/HubP family polar landmark protein [Immundisolibacter sp.]|uniref:FimV/HubP family polar landmark protein n=1 Tax=Immundisolibacter sp. TaxID=1934948 RepID=UPI0035656E1B
MVERTSLKKALAPALLLQLGLVPLTANALGLGNVRVDSALGQPLNARIELIGATLAEAELATISLASAEVYQRMGVQSAAMLRFAVQVGQDGRPYVRVTSPGPVREPYVDFVVEAISPTGRVVRHYTVLLDPVGALPAARPPAAAWSAGVTPIPAPTPRRLPRDVFADVGKPVAGAEFGPVPPGATLWGIARRVQPAGAGLDGVMSAIVRANPDAFINGDPNRLKAGSRLAIPAAPGLRASAVSNAEPPVPAVEPEIPAVAAPSSEAPAEASGGIEAAPPASAVPSAEVRVLRSEDVVPAASAGSEQQTSGEPTGDRIQLLEEALDATQQQNEALQERLGFLEEQIKTLTDLVKDAPPGSETGTEQNAVAATAAPPVDEKPPAMPTMEAAVTAPNDAAEASGDSGRVSSAYLPAAGFGAVVLGGWWLWMRRRLRAAQPASGTFAEAPGPIGAEAAPADLPGAPVPPPPAVPQATVEWADEVPAVASDEPLATDDLDNDALGDPVDSQIDLLAAYVGMADGDSARQIYAEIERVGTVTQKAQAAELIARLNG